MSETFNKKLTIMEATLESFLNSIKDVAKIEETSMLLESVRQLAFALSEIRTNNSILSNASLLAPDFTSLFDETVEIFEEFCGVNNIEFGGF